MLISTTPQEGGKAVGKTGISRWYDRHGDKMQLKASGHKAVVLIANQAARVTIRRSSNGKFIVDWEINVDGNVQRNQRPLRQTELECAFGLSETPYRNNSETLARVYGVRFYQENSYIGDGERLSLPGPCEHYKDCVSLRLKQEIKQAIRDLIDSRAVGPRFFSAQSGVLLPQEQEQNQP